VRTTKALVRCCCASAKLGMRSAVSLVDAIQVILLYEYFEPSALADHVRTPVTKATMNNAITDIELFYNYGLNCLEYLGFAQ